MARPTGKIPFKSKQRVAIFLTPEKELEFKRKALDAGISLSDLMSISASDISVDRLNAAAKDLG